MATPGDLAAILHKGENFQFAFMDTNLLLKWVYSIRKNLKRRILTVASSKRVLIPLIP